MESLKKDGFARKLIFVLRKIIECKKFDDTFIDKFLTNINQEFSKRYDDILHLTELSEWLIETLQNFQQTCPSTSEVVFFCKFMGVIANFEAGFKLLTDALNEFSGILMAKVVNENALKPVFIQFLSNILNHHLGYEWIKSTNQWKVVNDLYFSNTNLYVEREGLNFLKKLISKATFDSELCENALQEFFSPVKNYDETTVNDKKFCAVVLLLLRLLQSILKTNIYFKNAFYIKLREVFDLQAFLDFLLENCKQEVILEEASMMKILFFLVHCEDKKDLLTLTDVHTVLDIFYVLLKKNQFNGIINLAKYCQVLLSEMSKELKCESKNGINCILIQLLPALICVKPTDSAICDIFIQKLFALTTPGVQKFGYSLRGELRCKVGSKPKDLALKGVLSVITYTECLNHEEAVVIFQCMSYLLKSFLPDMNCHGEPSNYCSSEDDLCIQDASLLSAVINALCVFIEKFKINWTESLESLALLKLTCILLENPNLTSTVVVQVFLLVKLAILNFMSPDLALLLNNTKDSSFDFLMPLLYKRLYDPNWEIRDSCLEVITAIAELSESKYPAFQQLFLENELYSFVVDIMEGDSESYVRASAIQALTAMLKIETLNKLLMKVDFPHKIIKLLQNESEGIVRREAALAIKQMYLPLSDLNSEIVKSFYEVMGYLAVCDLHWEVKINALLFWETVIQHVVADQGMIDGSFPKVTFSKEHKKIVNLTIDEVKLRLDKVLKKLSEIGCLYILLSILNDDCDMPVIRKSAQILSDLLTVLRRYGVIASKDFSTSESSRLSMKRKITTLDNCEKKKTFSSIAGKDSSDALSVNASEGSVNEENICSDVVIDEIVNEKDINLLMSVYNSKEEKTVNSEKMVLLQEVKLDAFLLQMQDFQLEKFLEDKQKWLVNVELDLKSLVSDSSAINLIDETNIMDCY